MSEDIDHETAAGRPRDSSIDEKVLAVTRELLVESGWDGLSVRMVAARAGVGRSSVNRRWSSKAELVLHAILGESPDLSPFEGTDLTGWIGWLVRGSYELFNRPDVRAAVPGLLIALQANDDLRQALWANFSGPAVALYTDHVNATTRRERRQAELDGRALLTMAAGAALMLTTIATEDASGPQLSRIARLLSDAVGV